MELSNIVIVVGAARGEAEFSSKVFPFECRNPAGSEKSSAGFCNHVAANFQMGERYLGRTSATDPLSQVEVLPLFSFAI
jgi:hypothetical protein